MIDGARGTAIGSGKQNTADMVAACAEGGSAALLCSSLTVNGVGGWFLPSRDELVLMYRNLKAAGAGGFHDEGLSDNVSYWASSQQTADMSVHVDFADLGRVHGDDKDFPRRVRAIRMILGAAGEIRSAPVFCGRCAEHVQWKVAFPIVGL